MMEILTLGYGTVTALLLSLWIGHNALRWLCDYCDKVLPKIKEPAKRKAIPGEVTGFIERTAFTLAWLYGGDAAVYLPAGMLAWLTLKMAANWNRNMPLRGETNAEKYSEVDYRNRWAFAGLLKGFVSMCFAGAGGAVGLWIMGLAK